jgi:hypothetical protein
METIIPVIIHQEAITQEVVTQVIHQEAITQEVVIQVIHPLQFPVRESTRVKPRGRGGGQ